MDASGETFREHKPSSDRLTNSWMSIVHKIWFVTYNYELFSGSVPFLPPDVYEKIELLPEFSFASMGYVYVYG